MLNFNLVRLSDKNIKNCVPNSNYFLVKEFLCFDFFIEFIWIIKILSRVKFKLNLNLLN